MALVDGQWREYGKDLPVEHLDEVGPVVLVEGLPIGHDHTGAGQSRCQLVGKDPALVLHQLPHPHGDGIQRLERAHPVG